MNKEEILNRLIQKSICINAGGKGCYSPYTNDMDWFSDIDNLILMYEQLQQENQSLKEQVDYLRRSIERKEETIIELEHERVPYENKYVEELKKQLEELREENSKYERKNQKYKEVIDKAIKKLEQEITFCQNESQGLYDKCNIAINREQRILDILKEVEQNDF